MSPVNGACPKQRSKPHPPNCSFFSTLLPVSHSPLHPLSHSRFISLLLFSFRNALLTKRFTNPGWYIIHDRLLWDWFRQMDSEREGGKEKGGGFGWKGESKKGCVPQCNSFTKPPHGPHLIFSSLLHFEKPYIKRSLYSLYVQKEAPARWGHCGWRWTMIFQHMHAMRIFRSFLTCAISSWPLGVDFQNPDTEREGVSGWIQFSTLWFNLSVMFNKVDILSQWNPAVKPSRVHEYICILTILKPPS